MQGSHSTLPFGLILGTPPPQCNFRCPVLLPRGNWLLETGSTCPSPYLSITSMGQAPL